MKFLYYLSGMMFGIGNTVLSFSTDAYLQTTGGVLLIGSAAMTLTLIKHESKETK